VEGPGGGILFGVGFALAASGAAWILGARRGLPLMAVLLAAAAAVYVGASWAEPRASGGLEAAAFVGFLILALAGWERAGILALGWLAHTGWDALHLTGVLHSSAPEWYQVACLVADPLLAGFLVWWSVPRNFRPPGA
jgi:hypothetical protein